MRAQIIINKFGIIQEGEGKKPPQGGVLARRTNRDLVVHLHNAVTAPDPGASRCRCSNDACRQHSITNDPRPDLSHPRKAGIIHR